MQQERLTKRPGLLLVIVRLGLALALLAAALGVQPAPVARAATITVNSTLDNTTAGDGNCTLREAINNANADADTTGGDCAAGTGHDTITLAANTYIYTVYDHEDANVTGDLDILATGGDLTINGAGAGSTIIRGPEVGNDRVFHIDPTGTGGITVNISGVTIQNGNTGFSGGGICNEGDNTVNIINSTLSDNEASTGGGIYNGGAMTVTNSTLSDNEADTVGGGIYNGGTVTVTNSTLSGNETNAGGGIYNGGTATVANSTIISNIAWSLGGGIFITSGTVTVTNSTISANTADDGGGIYNIGTLNVQNGSTIGEVGAPNTAEDGGGIYNSGSGTVTLTNSTISANTAGEGGGIYNRGTLNIQNGSTIGGAGAGNEATQDGGGIYNDDSAVTLNDSTVSGNTSGDEGGGIYSDGEGGGAALTLDGCTISGNTANDSAGGGIYLYYSSAALTNTTISGNGAAVGGGIGTLSDMSRTIDLVHCTITSNTAGTNGGGMQLEPTFTVNVLNTMVADNSAGGNGPDIYGTINSQDYNLIQDTSDATINGTTTHNVTGEDPQLGPLADNGGDTQTHALLPGSPAIDAIPEASCTLSTDQRGVSRPQGPACDIGAYETEVGVYLPLVIRNA
jgi:CSLREA domain-containing protein